MGFLEDLAAAKEASVTAERPKSPVIDVALNGNPYGVVFYRVPADEWPVLTMHNPPRDGATLDTRYGYSLAGVALEQASKHGRLVDAGQEVELTSEQWADLFAVQPGSVKRLLEVTVWTLNDFDVEQEIEAAKKASRASRKKPSK